MSKKGWTMLSGPLWEMKPSWQIVEVMTRRPRRREKRPRRRKRRLSRRKKSPCYTWCPHRPPPPQEAEKEAEKEAQTKASKELLKERQRRRQRRRKRRRQRRGRGRRRMATRYRYILEWQQLQTWCFYLWNRYSFQASMSGELLKRIR